MAREPVDENNRLSHMFEYVTSAHLRLPAKRTVFHLLTWFLRNTCFFLPGVQVVKRWILRSRWSKGAQNSWFPTRSVLMIAFKRVPNLKLLFWFLDYFRGVDIRKGIPMMFHTNIVLNDREIREPSGHVGEWRGHSAKTYVFVFFIS